MRIETMLNVKNAAALLLLFSVLIGLTGCNPPEKSPQKEEQSKQPELEGTIIALGDSLTAGLGVDETDSWPALLEKRLHAAGHYWQVINAGISGETSSGALARIKWILAQQPDIIILETGANDALRGIPIDVIRENITKSVKMLRENDVTVVLAGMQIVQNLGPDYTNGFAAIYPEVASETDCLLIPFFLQGVAGEKSLNQADSIHPNEEGHKIIAETVYPYIIQAIQKN